MSTAIIILIIICSLLLLMVIGLLGLTEYLKEKLNQFETLKNSHGHEFRPINRSEDC